MVTQKSFLIIFYSWPAQLENYKNMQDKLDNINSDILVYLNEEQFINQKFIFQNQSSEDFLNAGGFQHFDAPRKLTFLLLKWIFKNRYASRYIYFHGEVWGDLTFIPCIISKFTRSSIVYLNARVDGIDKQNEIPYWRRFRQKFGKSALIRKFVTKLSDGVVQISPASDCFLRQLGVPPNKIHHIPLPSADPQTVEVTWDHCFRKKLRVADINIVFIGRTSYQKGFDILCEALTLLGQQVNWTLTVFGQKDVRIQYENWFPREKQRSIFFAGPKTRDEIYSFCATYDCITVLPSRHQYHLLEQFGMVIAESLARGLRVVCSSAGALRFTGGDQVVRYDSDDSQALALAIIKASYLSETDPSRRAFYLRNYSEKTVAILFEQLFDFLENENTTSVN